MCSLGWWSMQGLHRPSLTENAPRHFQSSLLGYFEYVPYTALTIV